jgi:hypothetical protein
LIIEAGLERKSNVFNNLKKWDAYRAGAIIEHRRIMDSIHNRLEKRAEWSDRSIVNLIKIYERRIEYELECSKFSQS